MYNIFIRTEILLLLFLFSLSELPNHVRTTRNRRPSTFIPSTPVEACSQPPRKAYRLLIQCRLQSRPMQLHLRQQSSTSAINVGQSAHTAEPPCSAHAARPCTQELPLSPKILDLILQGVMNAVTKRLASIPSAKKISSTASVTSPSALATLHAASRETL